MQQLDQLSCQPDPPEKISVVDQAETRQQLDRYEAKLDEYSQAELIQLESYLIEFEDYFRDEIVDMYGHTQPECKLRVIDYGQLTQQDFEQLAVYNATITISDAPRATPLRGGDHPEKQDWIEDGKHWFARYQQAVRLRIDVGLALLERS